MDDPHVSTSQKRTPPWWSHLPCLAAWLLQMRQYPYGGTFMMGWLRAPTMDFIQFCKPA
jgi:hypothetical protein